MGWFNKLKTAKKVTDTVPNLSSPWNWILGIVNIILPGIVSSSTLCIGIGTLIGAIMCKSNGLTYLFGVLQLLLSVILIGWLWSILWGIFMIDRKTMKTAVKKGVEISTK